MTAEEFAPTKVNLALHVTGRRADGYHLLDSLVVFAGIGDVLRGSPSDALSLTVTGPEAAALDAPGDNLVLRAARLIGDTGVRITLDKRLPVSSGIGGGSSDAAATLRLLCRMRNLPMPGMAEVLGLGADVPVCLDPKGAVRMRGIGEVIDPVAALPPLDILLVNPRVQVPTGAVFAAMERRDNPGLGPIPDRWRGAGDFADWLNGQRNDLAAPAQRLAPQVGAVLAALRGLPGALHASMSGSGATCFALFARGTAAVAAREALASRHPGWWVAAGPLL